MKSKHLLTLPNGSKIYLIEYLIHERRFAQCVYTIPDYIYTHQEINPDGYCTLIETFFQENGINEMDVKVNRLSLETKRNKQDVIYVKGMSDDRHLFQAITKISREILWDRKMREDYLDICEHLETLCVVPITGAVCTCRNKRVSEDLRNSPSIRLRNDDFNLNFALAWMEYQRYYRHLRNLVKCIESDLCERILLKWLLDGDDACVWVECSKALGYRNIRLEDFRDMLVHVMGITFADPSKLCFDIKRLERRNENTSGENLALVLGADMWEFEIMPLMTNEDAVMYSKASQEFFTFQLNKKILKRHDEEIHFSAEKGTSQKENFIFPGYVESELKLQYANFLCTSPRFDVWFCGATRTSPVLEALEIYVARKSMINWIQASTSEVVELLPTIDKICDSLQDELRLDNCEYSSGKRTHVNYNSYVQYAADEYTSILGTSFFNSLIQDASDVGEIILYGDGRWINIDISIGEMLHDNRMLHIMELVLDTEENADVLLALLNIIEDEKPLKYVEKLDICTALVHYLPRLKDFGLMRSLRTISVFEYQIGAIQLVECPLDEAEFSYTLLRDCFSKVQKCKLEELDIDLYTAVLFKEYVDWKMCKKLRIYVNLCSSHALPLNAFSEDEIQYVRDFFQPVVGSLSFFNPTEMDALKMCIFFLMKIEYEKIDPIILDMCEHSLEDLAEIVVYMNDSIKQSTDKREKTLLIWFMYNIIEQFHYKIDARDEKYFPVRDIMADYFYAPLDLPLLKLIFIPKSQIRKNVFHVFQPLSVLLESNL